MSWLWWWCCDCCRPKAKEEEDQEEICTPINSNSSHVTDSESSQNSEDMGKVFSRSSQSQEPEVQAASKPPTVDADITASDVVAPPSTSLEVHLPRSDTTPIPHVPSSPQYPLATPRSPLRRTLRDAITPGSSPVKPPVKRIKGDLQYIESPVLNDDSSIDYIKQSKVMLILKGLPGSGKTYLANKICEFYENVVVCSADKYFMQDGEYNFDREKLKEAHESCQQAAREAVKNNIPVVVIDNTNVQNWEMAVYLELARDYFYVPLVLEAQTPWAFDPEELFKRNSHGVPVKVLQNKVKSYQPVMPVYYGWFLNEADSWKLCSIARDWLEAAVKVEHFFKDLSHHINVISPEELVGTYSRQTYRDGGSILHCTASFTARGKDEKSREYIDNPIVKNAMGKCFPLYVIGFTITPRTFGARLRLTENQLELWGQNDAETNTRVISHPHEQKYHTGKSPKEKRADKGNDLKHNLFNPVPQELLECRETVTFEEQSLPQADKFHPTSGKGSRAHITIGCVPGVKPVTTGFDLVDMVQREKEAQSSLTDVTETFSMAGGTLRNYGDGMWALHLDKEIKVFSLFSAYYGAQRR